MLIQACFLCFLGRWKPLSLPKAASDSNVAELTPETTTQDPGPGDGPGPQSTFDVTEAIMIPPEFPATQRIELPSTGYPDEPFLSTHNVELEQVTQSVRPWGLVETTPISEIPQHVEEMKSTSPPKMKSVVPQREQEPTYSSVKSHLSHTEQELKYERESETPNPQDMNEIILNSDIPQHVQEMMPTSLPKTSLSTHRGEQVTTFSSTESQPSPAMWDMESERETESINPSDIEFPTVTQGLKPTTEEESPIHWDNMPEGLPVTQNEEPTTSTAETQPTSTTWGLEPVRETEASDQVGTTLSPSSGSLEATTEMQLPTTTSNVQPLTDDMEGVIFDVTDSGEITSLKDQMKEETLNTDSHPMQSTGEKFPQD